VQGGEGDAGQQPGEAPLHAAKREHPDHAQQAAAQHRIGLATPPAHTGTLPLHRHQFSLGGGDEDLDVRERVPGRRSIGAGVFKNIGRDHIQQVREVVEGKPPYGGSSLPEHPLLARPYPAPLLTSD
jgi:hypothetical protein